MVDFALTEEQRHWQQVAATYARTSLAPVIAEVEARPDPLDRMPWPQLETASQLGLRTLTAPESWGGQGADWMTLCLVAEEIAAVDIGMATTLELCWLYGPLLFGLMTDSQKERFLRPFMDDPRFLLAPCFTEPDAGSDYLLPYDGPDGGIRTLARPVDDGWVINGRKHFTSSGGCSKLYLILARTALDRPQWESMTLFVTGPDEPGFRIVRIHEKSSHRTSVQAEEAFEDLRLSDLHRVGPVDGLGAASRPFLAPAHCLAAAGFLGTARGAFELALSFARERRQGGKAIIHHQAVAMMLAEMELRLEATRYVVWNAAWRADRGDFSEPTFFSKAKVIASEASFECARLATEIFGGRGVMAEYNVERFLRDATANLHDFGANQVHRLRVATALGHDPTILPG